jgi:hypothetical protein
MIRLLFAFSWGNYELFRDHYPGRPTAITDNRDRFSDFEQWLFEYVPGVDYGPDKYFNMYHLFLWTMKRTGVIE